MEGFSMSYFPKCRFILSDQRKPFNLVYHLWVFMCDHVKNKLFFITCVFECCVHMCICMFTCVWIHMCVGSRAHGFWRLISHVFNFFHLIYGGEVYF